MPMYGYKNLPLLADMFLQTFDYESNRAGYVGTKIMPIDEEPTQAGEYLVLTKDHLLKRSVDDRISKEGNFQEVSGTWGRDGYSTTDHGLEFRLTDRDKLKYGNDIGLELFGGQMLNQMLAENHEKDVIAQVNAVTPTASAAPWTTISTDILGIVEAAIARLRAKLIPIDPSQLKIVVDWTRWKGLRKNVGILDTFGSSERTDAHEVTKSRIADILEVGEIIVANSMQNTAGNGATANYTGLWDPTKVAVICTGSGESHGRNVRWGNTILWKNGPARFHRYMKENGTGEVMRQRIDRTEKVVCADAIEVISAC